MAAFTLDNLKAYPKNDSVGRKTANKFLKRVRDKCKGEPNKKNELA